MSMWPWWHATCKHVFPELLPSTWRGTPLISPLLLLLMLLMPDLRAMLYFFMLTLATQVIPFLFFSFDLFLLVHHQCLITLLNSRSFLCIVMGNLTINYKIVKSSHEPQEGYKSEAQVILLPWFCPLSLPLTLSGCFSRRCATAWVWPWAASLTRWSTTVESVSESNSWCRMDAMWPDQGRRMSLFLKLTY